MPKNKSSKLEENQKDSKKFRTTRIFVHGLHPFTTTQDLITCFSRIGAIHDIEFRKDHWTGKHNGYAFFSVKDVETAEKMVKSNHSLHGRKIHCDLRHTDPKHQMMNQKKRLFVGGIPKFATDDQLTAFFSKWGEVRAAYSIKNLEGKSKSYGFVDFFNHETAEEVLKAAPLEFKGRRIDVRPYKKKSRKWRQEEVQEYEADFPKIGVQNFSIYNNAPALAPYKPSYTPGGHQNDMDRLSSTARVTKRKEENSRIESQKVQLTSHNRPMPVLNSFLTPFMNRKGENLADMYRHMNSLVVQNNLGQAIMVQRDISQQTLKMENEGYFKEITRFC